MKQKISEIPMGTNVKIEDSPHIWKVNKKKIGSPMDEYMLDVEVDGEWIAGTWIPADTIVEVVMNPDLMTDAERLMEGIEMRDGASIVITEEGICVSRTFTSKREDNKLPSSLTITEELPLEEVLEKYGYALTEKQIQQIKDIVNDSRRT